MVWNMFFRLNGKLLVYSVHLGPILLTFLSFMQLCMHLCNCEDYCNLIKSLSKPYILWKVAGLNACVFRTWIPYIQFDPWMLPRNTKRHLIHSEGYNTISRIFIYWVPIDLKDSQSFLLPVFLFLFDYFLCWSSGFWCSFLGLYFETFINPQQGIKYYVYLC